MATPVSVTTTEVYVFDVDSTPTIENVTVKKTIVDEQTSTVEVNVSLPWQGSIYLKSVSDANSCIAVLQYIRDNFL